MSKTSRGLGAAMALLATAAALPGSSAGAQAVTAVGVAEYDTNETLLVLGGISFSPWTGPGVSPVFGVQAYHLSFDGAQGRTSIFSVRPSAGLRFGFTGGAAQARIGYAFTSRDVAAPVAGGLGDRRRGVVLSGQVDWWGTGGPLAAQAIAAYNFGSEALWTRGRLTTRIAPAGPGGQLRLGGEVAYLNEPNFTMVQPGAVLEWHTGRGPIVAFGVGRKLNDPGDDATYFKAEVVVPLLRR